MGRYELPNNRDFGYRFEEASKFLKMPAEELLSIKVRPLIDGSNGSERNLYLSPDDYKDINQALKISSVPAKKLGYGC
jgi:hypothetical protein